ncbi:hypothetical protein VMCG_06178 [Cytospora schulzeri]|uniref:Uncharacterized protein n=1 Tax=Cytospora schulzeri TaxID=448051 RepID=A0A423W9E2_9PEZI|nr:hypothetical protein VMCG_06178 [Valsa malicola]
MGTSTEKVDGSTSYDVINTGRQEDVQEQPVEEEHKHEREAGWADYFRVFTYAKKWDFALMAAGAVASIGSGVTVPLINVIFGRLVGGFTTFGTPGASMTKAEFESKIDYQVLLIFILFLVRFTLTYISKFSYRLIGIRISAAIRLHYFSSLLNQTVHVLDSMPPGAAAGTITSTANTLQVGISEKLGTFLEFAGCIVAAIIVAFTSSWQVTLVTSSVILFIGLTVGTFLPFIIKGTNRSTRAETRAAAVATESFSAIRMVKACGAQGRMAERYEKWVAEVKRHGQYTAPFLGLNFGVIFFGIYGAFALSFWYGTRAYSEGLIDGVGTIVVVLMSIFLVAVSLERMSGPLIDASKATVAAATFFAVIDAPRPERGSLKEPDVTADGDIVFEGVTFAYPGRPTAKVLDDLNLTVEAGKVTAIVGPSGSGKSTIVGLVEQWYTLHSQTVIHGAIQKASKKKKKAKKKKEEEDDDGQPETIADTRGKTSLWARLKAQRQAKRSAEDREEPDANESPAGQDSGEPIQLSGRIMTSGHNLDDVDVKWWRSQIGLVQQEPFLFNDSIYNNVIYGLVGTQWEDEPLEVKQELAKQACKEAFADEFIDRLPEGYDTQVGDSGLKLSGGQRQRIAIARSIVKKPKILILDEATSAIDVRSEKIIQAALDRVSQGRTTIMIAHRLSTIAKADKIMVLQKGRLMEQGTHESLLSNEEGVYSRLESSKWASEAIGAFRSVSALTLEDMIIQRYERLLHGHTMAAYRKARWKSIVIALSGSLPMACQALILWYGGRLLAGREYGVLSFFVCYQAVMSGAESAGAGFSFGPNVAQATAAANRILSVREIPGEEHSKGLVGGLQTGPGPEGDGVVGGGGIPDGEGGVRIEFRDVAFRYPTRDTPIFKHLDITVEKGQFAALVGASGAGKSSIVALLERFYDIQQGSILCNGRDIRSVDVYEYRKLLSLVAQEATLFQGTIRENILFGVPDTSTITDAQLHQACRDASIHDFIVSLPEGYNTDVGSRGVALSGGQKQRISIARAIIRDPKVLLLDEATSSLDSESEKQITAALQKVAKGRTTLAVAHRLSTIQHADVIYVLGEGSVLEVGNHAELLRKKGVYYTMVSVPGLPLNVSDYILLT